MYYIIINHNEKLYGKEYEFARNISDTMWKNYRDLHEYETQPIKIYKSQSNDKSIKKIYIFNITSFYERNGKKLKIEIEIIFKYKKEYLGDNINYDEVYEKFYNSNKNLASIFESVEIRCNDADRAGGYFFDQKNFKDSIEDNNVEDNNIKEYYIQNIFEDYEKMMNWIRGESKTETLKISKENKIVDINKEKIDNLSNQIDTLNDQIRQLDGKIEFFMHENDEIRNEIKYLYGRIDYLEDNIKQDMSL